LWKRQLPGIHEPTVPNPKIRDTFWIHDADTMALLGDATRLELIERLLEPHSVTELAKAMDVPRTRLYHHMRLLEGAGLIVPYDSRAVGALTETRFRATARSFQASNKYLRQADAREQAVVLLESAFGATRADVVRAVGDLGDKGNKTGAEQRLAVARRLIRASPGRFDELVARIEALIERYDAGDDAKGTITIGVTYVVHRSTRRV
jgi:AcrR family transcriptional regulator